MSWLRHPYTIYVITLSLFVGVTLATVWSISWLAYIGLAAVACVTAAGIRYVPDWYLYGWWTLVALLLVAGGMARTEAVQQRIYESTWEDRVGEVITITGVVTQEPETSASAQQVVVRVDDTTILLFTERYQEIAYGDRLAATGRLVTPQPFSAEYGRVFPYDHYLAAQGVAYTMQYPQIEHRASHQGRWWLQYLYDLKDAFRQQLHRALPEPQVALGEGLLLGVKSALGDELEAAFRTTGLIHIVVLSGFNVMLVVAFFQYVIGFFLPLRPRLVLALLGIVGFAFLVGLSATVVRASLMAGIYLVAQYLGRHYEAIRGLLLAGAIMVWWQPLTLLYDIGFQLSFVATLGLILVSPRLEVWFTHGPRAVAWRSYAVATLATQVAIWPLLLYHIGEFSVVAPLVNMLVLPLVAVAMGFTFAVGVVGAVWPDGAVWVGAAAQLPLTYIITVARVGAALPFASFWVPAFSVGWVIIAYVGMGWAWYYITRRQQTSRAAALLPTDRARALSAVPVQTWQIHAMDPTSHTQNPPRGQAGR